MSEQQEAGTRWGDSITIERQGELRAAYEANVAAGKAPYEGVDVGTRSELVWVLHQHQWSGEFEVAQRNPADLRGIHLRRVDLTNLSIEAADLREANLYRANLCGAHLRGANLQGAILRRALLCRASFRDANLQGADLKETRMDVDTNLGGATFDTQTQVGGIRWNGVPLERVNWPRTYRLGDEMPIKQAKHRRAKIKAYRDAALAYRTLSTMLRAQGLLTHASRYRQLERGLERRALFWGGSLGGWLFSWLLNIVAGYGERPARSFIAYLLVIFGFAAAFFAIGSGILGIGGHEAINSPISALVFSVTSFHGRGFFPGGGLALDDPITILAACEAIMGLFIEITFIATFTQRFFAR
jgi:hypothetical protein